LTPDEVRAMAAQMERAERDRVARIAAEAAELELDDPDELDDRRAARKAERDRLIAERVRRRLAAQNPRPRKATE
jgi:hypothetical protein